MNLFELFGKISINNKGANEAITETSKLGGNLAEKLQTGFGKIGKIAVGAGKVVATGLAVGSVAMGKLVIDALSLAGDLEQAVGGSQAVFGRYAVQLQHYAETAYKTMGMSQEEYLSTANKMGSLFKGSGIEASKAMELTNESMQRAADVASLMGLSTEDAMNAVTGMAKGNFTMMDNLGVAMNDTILKAYAKSKGMKWDKIGMDQKVLLAQEYFMERTAYAAGNYAKENDTLAGSLNTAKAAVKNFLSGAGGVDQVVDSFSDAADVIVGNLNTLLPKLTKGLAVIIKRLTPKIGPLLQTALPGIIDGALSLLIGLAEALPGLITVLVAELPNILSTLANALATLLPVLLDTVKDVIASIDFKELGEWVGNAIVYLVNDLPNILTSLGQAIQFGWNNIVWPLIQGLFKAVFGVDLPDWETLKTNISDGWNNKVWPAVQEFFKTNFGIEIPSWQDTVQSIKDWWDNVWASINGYWTAVFTIQTTDENGQGLPWQQVIKNWFDGVMAKVGDYVCAILGLKTTDENGEKRPWGDVIKEWFDGIIAKIGDFFVSLGIKFPTWEDISASVSALWDSIAKAWDQWKTDLNIFGWRPFGGGDSPEPGSAGGHFATGLDRVPSNDYPALLHRNEAVLTASEASAWRSGNTGGNNAGVLEKLETVAGLLRSVVANTGTGTNIVLDSGALVGQLAPQMDATLGAMAARRER